jgi:hypothetical protein
MKENDGKTVKDKLIEKIKYLEREEMVARDN